MSNKDVSVRVNCGSRRPISTNAKFGAGQAKDKAVAGTRLDKLVTMRDSSSVGRCLTSQHEQSQKDKQQEKEENIKEEENKEKSKKGDYVNPGVEIFRKTDFDISEYINPGVRKK